MTPKATLQNWVIRVLLLLSQTESCRIRKTFRTASGSRITLPRLQSTLNAWLSPASVLIWLLHMQDSKEKICLSGPEACLGALAARRVLEIEFLACQALCSGRPPQCIRNEWASSESLPNCHWKSQMVLISQSDSKRKGRETLLSWGKDGVGLKGTHAGLRGPCPHVDVKRSTEVILFVLQYLLLSNFALLPNLWQWFLECLSWLKKMNLTVIPANNGLLGVPVSRKWCF